MATTLNVYLKSMAVWAPLPIRLALGAVFIAHGAQKLFGVFGGHGISGTIGMMQAMGAHPAVFFGWLVALVEFFGGLAIVFGFLTGLAALAIMVDMIVAVAMVHWKNGFFLGGPHPGFEYNLALIAMCLSLIFSGPGMLSIDRLIRWKY